MRDRRQLSLANASLSCFLGPPEADLTAQYKCAYGKYALQPLPAGVHPQNAFPHLAPQSASYYKYMWSQTLALDMFTRFEKGAPTSCTLMNAMDTSDRLFQD